MAEERKKDETYVFLNFNDKVSTNVTQEPTFLRMANLDTEHPLIQINDLVFKGSYDYSLGTNLFYNKESETIISPTTFEKPQSVKLKFVAAQTKVINFKQMKVPPKKTDIPSANQNFTYNLDWDYNELLKKFEEGTLELKDMVHVEDDSSNDNVQTQPAIRPQELMKFETINEHFIRSVEEPDPVVLNTDGVGAALEASYEKLLILARQPMRTEKPEEIAECDPDYKKLYNYKSIECKVLQPPLFKTKDVELSEKTLLDFINIERCGVIEPLKGFQKKLSDEDKKRFLVVENFDNLTLPARYIVMRVQLEKLEKHINELSEAEINDVDEYCYTPKETMETFKKLIRALERRIKEDYSVQETSK